MDINRVSSAVRRFSQAKDVTAKQNQVTYVKTHDLIPSDKNKEFMKI